MSTLLGRVAEQLGWPAPEAIWAPEGVGASILVEMAQRKIGRALTSDAPGVSEVRVGVLTGDPASDATEAPLAIVCEFGQNVSEGVLQELHTLAWNFARSPLLITLEPTRVRSWSCFESPKRTADGIRDSRHAEIHDAGGPISTDGVLAAEAVRALDWVNLASGEFFRTYERHFPRDRRADRTLLDNLRYVRHRLVKPDDASEALSADVAHDLLARLIFIQFLFQRRDSSGTPALTPVVLHRLYQDGRLRNDYGSLEELLRNHRDSYAFFRWLNTIFNGDLFPAKGETESERDREWEAEERLVRACHLRLLAEFVSGSLVLERGQLSLWPLYSFDVIPLEFISSVYEEFVHHGADDGRDATGTHYTPLHLVDFILDAVLPWTGAEWDLKVLDPACGSGVFLVKAYQRLVHRWKRVHPGERITAEVLRRLLERNLVGIDVDPHAVRVASFSLYLAMCDEIDPRDYWKRVRFPVLRGRRLLANDFFCEDVTGIRSGEDAGTFDLVLGNAPWGHTSASDDARAWAREHGWPLSNRDLGPLFLAKAARLAREGAAVALLQPAGLLLNRYGPADAFRRKLFSTYKVEEVVNLSALRRQLFTQSAAPSCCVILRNLPPDDEPLRYVCPKPTRTGEDEFRIVIDANDVNDIYPEEAAADPRVWTVFMWGGRRDYSFVQDLQRLPTLAKLREGGLVHAGAGLEWGDRQGELPQANGRRLLASPTLPEDTFVHLDTTQLEVRDKVLVHSRSPTDLRIFQAPQLIVKRSWTAGDRRFRAALVLPTAEGEKTGVLCTQSYVSVSVAAQREGILAAAFLAFSSGLAVYHTLMTSGRLASYRPEALVGEILDMPLPPVPATTPTAEVLRPLSTWSDVEARAQDAYGLPAAHRALVEDVVRYTLPNFKEDARAPGWQPTQRRTEDDAPGSEEPELRVYCDYFLRVLREAFATDDVCATIYHDAAGDRLPVRLVAVHLDWPGHDEDVRLTRLASGELRRRLLDLDARFLRRRDAGGSAFYQRVARIYDTVKIGRRKVPTVFLVKPDRARYWTRSMAMRDADDVAVESGVWEQTALDAGKAAEPVRA